MRVRHVVAAVAVVGIAAAGCSSEGDDGAVDLDGGEPTAAPTETETETEPPVEVTDDATDPPEEEQLYPPLPPLEPDPDSDIPVEDQEFLLELHRRVYEATQRAAADPTYDLGNLSDVLSGAALEGVTTTVETWRSDGLVNLSPDTEIDWVRVTEVGDGKGLVEECRIYGPMSGLYDGDELVSPSPEGAFIVQMRYGLAEAGGEVSTYALESGVVEGDECAA